MIRRHQLLPGDFPRREQFCNWLLERPDRFLDDLTMGDEAAFGLSTFLTQCEVVCAQGTETKRLRLPETRQQTEVNSVDRTDRKWDNHWAILFSPEC